MCVFVQYQQEIALLQEKLRVAALRQDECEARLLIQDQQNQRMLQEYQVTHLKFYLYQLIHDTMWFQFVTLCVCLCFSGSAGGHREQTEEAAGR